MASKSESPSITQFFKHQRKRPRLSEKEEGINKKLVTEDGAIDAQSVIAKSPDAICTTQDETASSSKTTVQSPVKFFKLGSLSPANKKKMSTEQVSRVLKKATNLRDLKSALQGMNNCAEKLEEFRRLAAQANAKHLASPLKKDDALGSPQQFKMPSATKSPKGMSPAQFYSPRSEQQLKNDLDRLSATKTPASPSKLVNLNNKVKKRLFEFQDATTQVQEEPTKVPAYQRFHNLAQKSSAEVSTTLDDLELELPLPYHFKVLKELFVAVETVLGIMKNRKELITFPKLKAGVLELVRKFSLKEKHLAQMATVLPGCYKFSLGKVGKDQQIRIEVEDLTPSVVCARRKAFHSALIKIAQEHHMKFLLGQVPPVVIPADKQITRWHPCFKLDQIPEITPIENILPLKSAQEKACSARDVIAKAQNILENANPRMKQAMQRMLNESKNKEEAKVESDKDAKEKPKSAAMTNSLKGVSSSLLEKIRNRERQKLLNEMTRSPAENKKLKMMKRLPQFVKIIRNMLVAEKKVALQMDVVIERVCHSIQNMSPGDTNAHIRLLMTLLPHWVKIVKLSNSDMEYLRIDKNVDINSLLLELEDIIKKHSD